MPTANFQSFSTRKLSLPYFLHSFSLVFKKQLLRLGYSYFFIHLFKLLAMETSTKKTLPVFNNSIKTIENEAANFEQLIID